MTGCHSPSKASAPTASVRAVDAEAHATLALAAMKGLILDLAATGQRHRIRRAGALLSRLLDHASS